MSHPIDPARLLHQARVLAGVGAGRGRPSPTNHRRAVSSAYYALFHRIALAAARHALPANASDTEIRRATRWVNHREVHAICDVVSTCAASTAVIPKLPKGLSPRAAPIWEALSAPAPGGARVSVVPADLRFLANVFSVLQAARHSADYDHLAEFPKATAIGYVADAAFALERVDANAADPDFQRFLAWVLAKASGFGV